MTIKIVRRTLADGTVKTYRYERKSGRIQVGSLGALIQEYRRSPEFAQLRPNTKKIYMRAIGKMSPIYDVQIVEFKRRHAIGIRDKYAHKPALANQMVAMFSTLMRFAVDREYREHNPAQRVEYLPMGEHRRWQDREIDLALERLPERFRRAVLLALYTGQRQGDVLAMKWSDYDGQGIQVTQEKTGAKLWVPCHGALRAELESWKKDRPAITIISTAYGRPFMTGAFATAFTAAMRKHVGVKGLRFHGLRKTAAAKLAEAGCSTHEIAAITGHKSLAMLSLYTREAEQKTRAMAAVIKLENVFHAGRKRGA